jgi:hypothetical protein
VAEGAAAGSAPELFVDVVQPMPWATFTEGAAGSGNANVRIRIEANPGAARRAILIIAGERFTLTQEASKK